ncbi:MAG: hypothetical protein SGARI_003437, partial [Bacillariaceae sp.]
MGAYCHRSMNPWDDDLDITVASCKELDAIFDAGMNVTDVYSPNEIKPRLYSFKEQWIARLVDNDWILIKGVGKHYKLKAIAEIRERP